MVCTASSCVCPTPAVGAPIRLTNTPGLSLQPHVAWNGNQVALAWVEVLGTYSNEVHLALLDPDGSRAIASDTVVVPGNNYVSTTVGYGPWVSWTGSEWLVAWIAQAARIELRGFDVTGAPTTTSTTIMAPGYYAGGDLFASATQGLGFIDTGVSFRRLGVNGSVPETPVYIAWPNGAYWPPMHLAASAAGQWGFVIPNGGTSTFVRLNADGSHTLPDSTLAHFGNQEPPLIAHDGLTWLAAFVEMPAAPTLFRVARGDTLSSTFDLLTESSPSLGPAFRLSALRLGSGYFDVLLGSLDGSSVGRGILRMARYRLPSGATAAPVPPLATPVTILSTPNANNRTSIGDSVHTGPSSSFVVWADDRWGTSNLELYGAAVDFLACA